MGLAAVEMSLIGQARFRSLLAPLVRISGPRLCFLLYLVWGALSALLSPYEGVWLGLGRYEGLFTILLNVLVFSFISSYGRWDARFLDLLGAVTVVNAVMGLLQYAGWNPLNLFPEGTNYHDAFVLYNGQFMGTFGNVDFLGGFLCIAVPVFYGGYLTSGRKRLLVFTGAGGLLLALTGVDAGYLGIAGALFLTLPLYYCRRQAWSRGTAIYDGRPVEGTWSFKEGAALTNVADNGSKTVVFTPAEPTIYAAQETTIQVTINKATPIGKPGYTAINISGKTLADAALNVGTITPAGSIAWDDGDETTVTANTSYGWTFTPEDTGNYTVLTGTLRPYTVSSGGGDGGSSGYTVTVEDTDNGTVTVSPKSASKGTTVTITVKPDSGYELDTLKVTDKNGDKLSVTEKNGKYTFTMPASKVTVKVSFQEIEPVFSDVPASAYYADAVAWAVENGITSGTTAATFSPNGGCTHAQAVTFLWRAAGSPAPKSGTNPFSDVKADAYYADAVLWAVEQGITKGTTDTTFSPNATCTRAQIVTFLWRSEGTPAADTANPFTDVADGAYYLDAVNWAVAEGITGGTTATTFSPNVTCTRAQIVTFLYRCLGE